MAMNLFTTKCYVDPFSLTYDLFNEIGLGIAPDGNVFDRDTGIMLLINDKYIKASIDPEMPIYPGEYYTTFDIYDMGIMDKIFGYYLDKETSMGNINVLSYWSEEDKGKYAPSGLALKHAEDGTVTYTDRYFCKALKYSAMIMTLAGYKVNLSGLDIIPEDVLKEMKRLERAERAKANATKRKSRKNS